MRRGGNEILVDIVRLCLSIDSKAAACYKRFYGAERRKDLKEFWREMHEEEKTHISCWKYLLDLADKETIPPVFNDPHRTLEDLESTAEKLDRYIEEGNDSGFITSSFVIAFNLEFSMLDMAFADLFHLVQLISSNAHPAYDAYDAHINKFIENIDKFSDNKELELLGSTLQRTWKQNKELVRMANTDYLTAIFNRRGIFQAITPLAHLAQRNDRDIGVLMIDIDDFKRINDNHGHLTGDEVLRFIADSIRASVRQSDVVGRYGGEEFIVFLSEIDPAYLMEVGEKIRRTIERESRDRLPPVTVSIGLSLRKLGADVLEDIEQLIREADDCLYRAKSAGKNRVVGSDLSKSLKNNE